MTSMYKYDSKNSKYCSIPKQKLQREKINPKTDWNFVSKYFTAGVLKGKNSFFYLPIIISFVDVYQFQVWGISLKLVLACLDTLQLLPMFWKTLTANCSTCILVKKKNIQRCCTDNENVLQGCKEGMTNGSSRGTLRYLNTTVTINGSSGGRTLTHLGISKFESKPLSGLRESHLHQALN